VSEDHHHHPAVVSPVEAELDVLESLLIERGILDTAAMDGVIEYFEHQVGPMNGATVVARAWNDPAYRSRLLSDATKAIGELGFGYEGEHIVVVENTERVHNVIVCTLCSCYPWSVLGLPPNWYKSAPYRARMVREPRVLLAEMGCSPPDDVEIRVWDSSAEVRYLVLPRRPAGTGGLDENQLAALVSRDAMIGVAEL
jgi:nitrile hydratase